MILTCRQCVVHESLLLKVNTPDIFLMRFDRVLYKLIDFGAARELQEEEQFMSLYGTEEYLVRPSTIGGNNS